MPGSGSSVSWIGTPPAASMANSSMPPGTWRTNDSRVPSREKAGTPSTSGPLDEFGGDSRRRIDGHDVAEGLVVAGPVLVTGRREDEGDPPVDRRPEWGRHVPLAADVQNGGEEQEQEQGGEQGDGPPRDLPDALSAERGYAHGEPPFKEGPARPLAHARGPQGDVGGVLGRPRGRRLGEPRDQVAFEAVVRAHAIWPFWTPGCWSSASSRSAIRSDARALPRRDWAVPTGTPSASATPEMDMPT